MCWTESFMSCTSPSWMKISLLPRHLSFQPATASACSCVLELPSSFMSQVVASIHVQLLSSSLLVRDASEKACMDGSGCGWTCASFKGRKLFNFQPRHHFSLYIYLLLIFQSESALSFHGRGKAA
ncbi:hypothetical protein VIGAN_UM190400 [Vigna angularis var. angularis]|uniref:Uncharacterized protein n=1 Tax=Vigna angularis var. angularis TaxID=157739 RepID=A0A0S3TFC1_PHAAN|nr:hypothetical protein VIGAN_UM190400 [Vigna angularis var. angularis]